ncbi:hypothetical protein CDAR_185341 [Caerostris darwini]|uniref:Uncharacterized protein n=1 Tax=Caerostris darwini TaxID=1538125 RepID=A0AAV4SR82_9ARAC|nr:hypothetical protein CDAR_185341 [Caerostris darwini]
MQYHAKENEGAFSVLLRPLPRIPAHQLSGKKSFLERFFLEWRELNRRGGPRGRRGGGEKEEGPVGFTRRIKKGLKGFPGCFLSLVTNFPGFQPTSFLEKNRFKDGFLGMDGIELKRGGPWEGEE